MEKVQYKPIHFKSEGGSMSGDEMIWAVMHCSRHKVRTTGNNGNRRDMFAWEAMNDYIYESFVPMMERVSAVRGVRKIVSSLAIPMIVFAHDTRDNLNRMIDANIGIEFKQMKGKRFGEPTTVSDAEMSNFINVINNVGVEQFYAPEDYSKLHVHQKIKVYIGDEWCTGVIHKIQGSSKERLLVSIPNLMMASTVIDLKKHRFIELAD